MAGLHLNPPERAVVFSFNKTRCQADDRPSRRCPYIRAGVRTMTHDYHRHGGGA